MNNLVSVIIPAYNAASRIKLTLESIINQDYENIEIILVNDSSLDDTALIANKILSGSKRAFKIINHESNKGECASRNTGLAASQGEYICFIDADDMIEQNFVSSLYDSITRNNCKIAFCGLVDRFTDGNPDKDFHSCKSSEPYIESGEHFIINNSVPPVWCCMYGAGFLRENNLLFHEGCTAGGDIDFITKALCVAEKVTFIEGNLYIYVHHSEMGSIRDANTREKKFTRYEHNTNAQTSTAEFLAKHARSGQLRLTADKILTPNIFIRRLNIYSVRNDKASYDSFLQDKANREVIRKALDFYVLKKKPEVFFKAFMILYAPGIYFMLRRLSGL